MHCNMLFIDNIRKSWQMFIIVYFYDDVEEGRLWWEGIGIYFYLYMNCRTLPSNAVNSSNGKEYT